MGYTTNFAGSLRLSRKLTMAEAQEWLEIADMEPTEHASEGRIKGYLQWVPGKDFQSIVWDRNEKFYHYLEWLSWLCREFLAPKGITAKGAIHWQGERVGDVGVITMMDDIVVASTTNIGDPKTPQPLNLLALKRMALEQLTAKPDAGGAT